VRLDYQSVNNLDCVDREPKSLLSKLIIAAIPHTEPWRLTTALLMISCNLMAIAITFGLVKLGDRFRGASPDTKPALAKEFDLSQLVAAMSFGHMIGVGLVLGLTNIGII
jgi:photosystem I subunit X